MKILARITFLSLLAVMAACSSGSLTDSDDCANKDIVSHVSNDSPSDPEVFKLGSDDARKMLDRCQNIDEIENELLDVKARISLIDSRFGRKAAEDYTKGFNAYIKENNDSLAAKLF